MVKILRKTIIFDKDMKIKINGYKTPNQNFIYHITPRIGIKRNTEKDKDDDKNKVEEIAEALTDNKDINNFLLSIIVKISMIYKIPVWLIEYSPAILIEIDNLILMIGKIIGIY